jgi:hypothetical protein
LQRLRAPVRCHIRNTGALAELADHKTHVSVIDDPILKPYGPWEAEVYQRENLSENPARTFKFVTCDISRVGAETEERGLGDALDRMLLVHYPSASEAYLSDRLIRLDTRRSEGDVSFGEGQQGVDGGKPGTWSTREATLPRSE